MSNEVLGRKIEDFEDYVVTSTGDIYSARKPRLRKLKPQETTQSKKKYLQVRLFNDTTRSKTKREKGGMFKQMGKLYYVHRLVWKAFHGEIGEGLEIDHKDGNPHNNNVENLQTITRRENILKYQIKNRKNNQVYFRLYRDEIIQDFKKLKSMREVSLKWGCALDTIRRVIKNVYNTKRIINGKSVWKQVIFDESINDAWMTKDLRYLTNEDYDRL